MVKLITFKNAVRVEFEHRNQVQSTSRQHNAESAYKKLNADDATTNLSEGYQHIGRRSEEGQFGSIPQTQQQGPSTQSERNHDVPANITTTRRGQLNQHNSEDEEENSEQYVEMYRSASQHNHKPTTTHDTQPNTHNTTTQTGHRDSTANMKKRSQSRWSRERLARGQATTAKKQTLGLCHDQ